MSPTSVIAKLGPGRPNPEWTAWALARRGQQPAEVKNFARRVVEKIRTAWGSGRLQLPPFWDNYTEETPEIREAYLPMLREPMVKAPYSLSVAGVAALECQVIPARPDDERHKQAAAAFKAVLSRVGRGNKNGRACGTRLVASEILSGARIAGWSLCELVPAPAPYRWDGPARGKEYWLDIKSKDTRRLTPLVDEFKNVVAVRSFAAGAQTWEGRQLDSFVTYAHWPLYCSPTGTSDFRAVYRACWIKNVAWQLRAVGFDRFTHPYFQATYGDITQKAAIEEALQDARSEGYIVLPPGATATAVDLAMKSDEIFHSGIQDLDREILIGISWSHLPIQEGQTQGGRGDTKVQQATADLKLYDDAASLAGVVQGQMADPWYERNFADVEPGTVVWGAVQEKDLKVEADVDDVFVNKLGGKLSLQEAYKRYGRTPPRGPDDVLGGAPKPPPGQGVPPGFPPRTPPEGGGVAPFGGEGPDAQFCGGPGSGVPGPCPGPAHDEPTHPDPREAQREARKAARRQGRKDLHEAARTAFPGASVDVSGDDVEIETGGRSLLLEYDPGRLAVNVDFTLSDTPAGQSSFEATGAALQAGTLDFARRLSALASTLGDKGLGISYETLEPRRARVYAKMLSAAGFVQAAGGAGTGKALWRKPGAAAAPPDATFSADDFDAFCGGPGSGVFGPCPGPQHDEPKTPREPARVEAHPDARAAAKKLLGRDLADHEIAALACAPPGATVRLSVSGGKVQLAAEKAAPDGTLEFNSTREVYKPWFAPVTCKNVTFGLRGEGRGQGLALFDAQVRTLQGAGVKMIQTSAAGGPSGGGNGYYTWPRMGYGGPMTSQQVERLPDAIKKALGGKRDVRDVFDLPGGAEAWKAYGSSMKLTFDLTPGSRNMKALESYKAERAARG
jgi:hypothetical protein